MALINRDYTILLVKVCLMAADFYASGLPEVPSPGTDYCEYVRGTDWSMCSQSCGWGQSLRYRDKRCKPDVRHCQIRPCDNQQSHYKRVRYLWYYRPTLRIVNHTGLTLYSWLVWGLRLWRAKRLFGRIKIWVFKYEDVRNQENHRSEDRRSEDW